MRRLDVLCLILTGLVLVAGPLMALQELAKARDAEAQGFLVAQDAAPGDLDLGYRLVWHSAMLVLTLLVDLLGCLVMLRIGRQPRVRAVSGRLLALLVVGLAWLDLAYFVDSRYLTDARYLVRAGVVAWLYPLGALLALGSVFRLGDVESLMARSGPAPAAPRPPANAP